MYNLVEEKINNEPILKYEVWFTTPSGLWTTAAEACTWCISRDLDPYFNVKAVPVALTENGYEVL